MKNIIATISLLLICCSALSQNTLEDKIIGNWKVNKIIHASDSPHLKDFVDGLAASTFQFQKSNIFKLDTTHNSDMFKMLTDIVNDKVWQIKTNSIIAIGSESDKYNVMQIEYEEKNGIVIFYLQETDVELEMQKL